MDPATIPTLLSHLKNKFSEYLESDLDRYRDSKNWDPEHTLDQFVKFSDKLLTENRPVKIEYAGSDNYLLQLQDLTQVTVAPRLERPDGFIDSSGAVRL
jgi:hypothetical protein